MPAPGLFIPLHTVHGETPCGQFRPDEPRLDIRNGREPRKYETPWSVDMWLDVPPHARREQLGDPGEPLSVTEGARKADAAVSAGLTCVSLLGVWNFCGKNQHGGLTALPCWESVALKGRLVYVVFDSDVMVKPDVHDALVRIGRFLQGREDRSPRRLSALAGWPQGPASTTTWPAAATQPSSCGGQEEHDATGL